MEDFFEYVQKMMPNANMDLIRRAYEKAEEKHCGQKRKSGEDYIIHPIAVSKILIELGMDDIAAAAALLHDVVEDTDYTLENLRSEFGDEVANLVDGVTKLESLVYESKEEQQAENLRKMFLAMSKDIRVLVIKLADRLHNMRTIDFQSERKIEEISRETLEIYAPLANRLGIFKIKLELEDIALRNIDQEAYHYLSENIQQKMQDRERYIEDVLTTLRKGMDALGIKYDISARAKHFYSIYRKMKYQNKQLDEIFDLVGIRVIVETKNDCYAVLGIVHDIWKPIPGRFKDYIAMPKSNQYQSLHTTLFGKSGQPFEIQIRTYEMNKIAEYGIAAHWKYKEGIKHQYSDEEKLAWVRQTMEWNSEVNDPKEFMEALRMDLFSNQVFVLSPKGDIVELPIGSTPLDFAFKIHTQVGVKCVGAKINGKIVPIDYKLQNGNIVEIITSNNSKGPSIDWLKIAKSSHSKSKIKQWLKKENKSENAARGKNTLERYIRSKGYDPAKMIVANRLNKVVKSMNFFNAEDIYSAIGFGGLSAGKVAMALFDIYYKERQEEILKSEKEPASVETARKKSGKKSASGVVVKGVDNLLIRFSKCCTPIPGDPIIGFVTKGRGISVHRSDCVNVLSTPEEEKARFIEVEWDVDKQSAFYDMEINIIAENRKGLVADISKTFDEVDISINGMNAKTGKDNIATMNLLIGIKDLTQMDRALNRVRSIKGVHEVYRANN